MFFFFNDTATTEIYTLSLHDALPILEVHRTGARRVHAKRMPELHQKLRIRARLTSKCSNIDPGPPRGGRPLDRKSTRLNSSHANISYAVFCLKKKKKTSSILTQITRS